jgi:hypothetical protein
MPTGWMSSRRCTAAAVAAAGLAIVGCAGSHAGASQPLTQHRPASSGANRTPVASPRRAAPPRWTAPLTGLAVRSARVADRAAVALPVAGANPQGLPAADVVFEEMTSPVRYIAVFQSREDQSVGPVTAIRPTDAQALSVLHPLIGYDGGTAPFIRVLDRTAVIDLGYAGHPSLYRSAADGLMASTSQIQAAAHGTPPPPLFTYQGSGVDSQAQFATTGSWRTSALRVSAPGLGTQRWQFSARTGRWAEAAGGPAVQVANIVVQTVRYKTVSLSTRLGITVPSARVIGKGSALVLSSAGRPAGAHGVAVKAAWSKPGIRKLTNYFDRNGVPVGFQRGTTWVILAPAGVRVTTSGNGP